MENKIDKIQDDEQARIAEEQLLYKDTSSWGIYCLPLEKEVLEPIRDQSLGIDKSTSHIEVAVQSKS